jgi:UDP-N-acetyl-D-mannosaminuronate dehydrogenase
VSSPCVGELAKLIENTFRHVNIALANELAMFGHELGVDVGVAINAASTKPFGFMPFKSLALERAATGCPSTSHACPGGRSRP